MDTESLRIYLGLPGAVAPAVRYVFSVLFSPYKMDLHWLEDYEQLADGGIYYGTPLKDWPTYANVLYWWTDKKRWGRLISRDHQEPELVLFYDEQGRKVPGCYTSEGKQHGNEGSSTEPDLPASAFYWLATSDRNSRRDEHDRIPYEASLQADEELAGLPLVNVYARRLVKQLEQLGIKPEQKSWRGRPFAAAVTFDFDNLRKNRWTTLIRNLAGRNGRQPDFKTLMTQTAQPGDATRESVRRILKRTSELELHPTVFLKSVKKRHQRDARDYLDLPFAGEVINEVERQGGEIGYHSSYRAALDADLFSDEIERLRDKTRSAIEAHRSHYLRFDAAKSWKIWRNVGIAVDSTLGWSHQAGFRNACCTPFTGYEPGRIIPSGIIEFPLMAMDVQLLNHMSLQHEEVLRRLKNQIETVRDLGGVVVWNFHHHIFDPVDLPGGEKLFEDTIALLRSYDPCFGTLSELKSIYYEEYETDN